MKKIWVGLSVVLIPVLIAAGGMAFYLRQIRVELNPIADQEKTRPLRAARLEFDIPASWEITQHQTELMFHEPARSPGRSSFILKLFELPHEGPRSEGEAFNPNLFPQYQQVWDRPEAHRLELTVPADFGRPFKGLALVEKDRPHAKYVGAFDLGGYILYLVFHLNFEAGEFSHDPGLHEALWHKVLTLIDEVYTGPAGAKLRAVKAEGETFLASDFTHDPRLAEFCSGQSMSTRYGCLEQKPDIFWLRQHVLFGDQEDQIGGDIMSAGDCGQDRLSFCRGRIFEGQRDAEKLPFKLYLLTQGAYFYLVESGPKEINGFKAYATVGRLYDLNLPWGVDEDMPDSLTASLRLYPGPATSNTGDSMIVFWASNPGENSDAETMLNRAYGKILKVWSSVRPLSRENLEEAPL